MRAAIYALFEGNWDMAIRCYTESVRLNSHDAEAYLNRGVAYWSKGESSKMKADFAVANKLGYSPK